MDTTRTDWANMRTTRVHDPRPLDQILRSQAHSAAGCVVVGLTAAGGILDRAMIKEMSPGSFTSAVKWVPSNVDLEGFAMQCAAGSLANQRHLAMTGQLKKYRDIALSPHQWHAVQELLEQYRIGLDIEPGPDNDYVSVLYWDDIQADAARAVREHWQEITALADALLAAPNRVLLADEVASVTGIPLT